MKRSFSKSSCRKSTPAFQRIYSENNLKKISIPAFLKFTPSPTDLLNDFQESPEKSPKKPKILQKYSKDLRDSNRCSTFEEFSKYILHSSSDQIALIIHNHEISVNELKELLLGHSLSRNLIDCTLSVIKKKNRELTRRSDDYSRVLIGKTSFTEKLFSGHSFSARSNLLKFEFILFPLICRTRNTWSLIVLDNKNVKVTFFNYSRVKDSEFLFEYIKNFVGFQVNAEGKNLADTPYKQLIYQEVRKNDWEEEDSSVMMLVEALSISTSSHVLTPARRTLLHLLYNYGRV